MGEHNFKIDERLKILCEFKFVKIYLTYGDKVIEIFVFSLIMIIFAYH